MIKKRDNLVFYTTAVCNLKCRYCFIDKNPALKEIDDLLDESFKGDYYFNFAKECFPDPNQLKIVQLWGGEPSLRYDRVFYTLKKLINYYPNLDTLMTSTNFVSETFFEQFYGLLNVFGEFKNRNFIFDLQLSLDGPEELNDAGRGVGVTKKFEKHFSYLLENPEKVPKNVHLYLHLKPTLDNNSFRLLLNKEKAIEYFQYLESYFHKVKEANIENIHMNLTKPNMAVPSPHTTEDGKEFADFMRLLVDISKENKEKKYFKYYDNVVLFTPRNLDYLFKDGYVRYQCSGYTCNSGCGMVGLLPDRRISECHMGFVDQLESYKEYSNKNLGGKDSTIDFNLFVKSQPVQTNISFEELDLYERKVNIHYKQKTTFRISGIVNQIMLLAYAGQIDKKFKNPENALKAVYFLQEASCNCFRDNNASTGSLYLHPIGELRLFFNGASDVIESFIKEVNQ